MVALSQQRTVKYGLLFITLSALCWDMGTVMSKYALGYIPPITLLAVQLATSSLFLWLLTVLRKVPFTWNRESIRHGWTGILEPGLAYMFGLAGLLRTTASSASFIGATEPLLVIFLAWVLLRERFTRRVFGLIMLALFGTLLISGGQAEGSTSQSALGDLLVLIGVASAAFYVVISRSSVEHIHPLPLAALQQSFGLLTALVVLPFALAGGENVLLAAVPLRTWMWAVITGVIQYSCAFWFYLSAIQEIPATQAASFLMLIPVFGVASASLFLGEQLTFIQFIGGILILAALAGVYRARQPLS